MSNKKSLLSRLTTKGVLKRVALYGVLAVVMDRFTLPIVPYFAYGNRIKNEAIQEKMETEKYCFDYQGSNEETALKYLKLAHAVTTKYLDQGDPGVIDNCFDSRLLESKIGDCSETSRFTYSNFIYLVNSAERLELLGNVRLATGTVSNRGQMCGHMWVEILRDGTWMPYETTNIDLKEDVKINPGKIDSLIPNSWVIENTKYLKYDAMVTFQTKADGETEKRLYFRKILEADGAFKIAYNNFSE